MFQVLASTASVQPGARRGSDSKKGGGVTLVKINEIW